MLTFGVRNTYINFAFVILLGLFALTKPTIAQEVITAIPLTPEPTFISTLTPGQVAFEELLQTNGGCELPCWWGFDIGEVTEEDEME